MSRTAGARLGVVAGVAVLAVAGCGGDGQAGRAERQAESKATDAALRADLQAKGGAEADQAMAATAAVQQTLKLAGYWSGPVDG
jgi:hypothetical protein